MSKILTIFLFSLVLTSCGKIVDESLSQIVNQAENIINISPSFDQELLYGTWRADVGSEFASIDHLLEDSLYAPLTDYSKVEESRIDGLISNSNDCSLDYSNENQIDLIYSRTYIEFNDTSYTMYASSRVYKVDGSNTFCMIQVGSGQYSIVSNYIVFQDHNKSAIIEVFNSSEMRLGFRNE